MEQDFDTVIRISSDRAEIVVEQAKQGGVISRKNISPETLNACFQTSRYDEERCDTGLLPENCIAVTLTAKYHYYYIRHPELYTESYPTSAPNTRAFPSRAWYSVSCICR
jgi:hypothetical protein